jgi:hypothetical protein
LTPNWKWIKHVFNMYKIKIKIKIRLTVRLLREKLEWEKQLREKMQRKWLLLTFGISKKYRRENKHDWVPHVFFLLSKVAKKVERAPFNFRFFNIALLFHMFHTHCYVVFVSRLQHTHHHVLKIKNLITKSIVNLFIYRDLLEHTH